MRIKTALATNTKFSHYIDFYISICYYLKVQKSGAGKVSPHRSFFPNAIFVLCVEQNSFQKIHVRTHRIGVAMKKIVIQKFFFRSA